MINNPGNGKIFGRKSVGNKTSATQQPTQSGYYLLVFKHPFIRNTRFLPANKIEQNWIHLTWGGVITDSQILQTLTKISLAPVSY